MSNEKRPYFRDPEEAFRARTERRGECLIWTGYTNPQGYGEIRVRGRLLPAHRYAWERVNGPVPGGMVVDHKDHCDPACVEVKHLRPATIQQNVQNRRGAQRNNGTTGARNVYPHGPNYRVRVKKDGKMLNFGSYPTVEEAKAVAERTRKELFGDFSGGG